MNVLRPTSQGELYFTVFISPGGVIYVNKGQIKDAFAAIVSSASSSGFTNTSLTNVDSYRISNQVCNWNMPITAYTPFDNDDGQYRVVNAVHTIRFTGSNLANGGSVSVSSFAPVFPATEVDRAGTPPTRIVHADMPYREVVLSADSLVGAAKDSFTLMHLPRDSSYSESNQYVYTRVGYAGFVTTAGSGDYMPNQYCRIYSVRYQGLDPSASITVDSRVCVQETVPENSSLRPLARPSDFADSNSLNNLLGAVGSTGLPYRDWETDRKSTRLNSSHSAKSRMPSSA